MTERLPSIAPHILAEAVDALPARLRRRLDAMAATAGEWPVTRGDGMVSVAVDSSVTVTLTVSDSGTVTSSDDASCSCLLAPRCLHRAAVLARAPLAEASGSEHPEGDSGQAMPPLDGERETVTPRMLAAASALRQAATAVVNQGVAGVGALERAELLRAAHVARAVGCHRAAALARRIAAGLGAAHRRSPEFRLSDLSVDLRDLLLTSTALLQGGPGEMTSWIGTARRGYQPVGGLRLYGLCAVPVVSTSGYAGVTSYLVDRDGVMWTVSDVAPGGVSRAASAARATVALGETALTHQELTRAGLSVTGATATRTGRLGAGQRVRAVTATGVEWTADPVNRLWLRPLAEQVTRAFAALAWDRPEPRAGDELLFLTVRTIAAAPGTVLATTENGLVISLVGLSSDALGFRESLRALGARPGLEFRVIGRPDRTRRRTLHVHALAPVGFELARRGSGHLNLGFERLHPSQLPQRDGPVDPGEVSGGDDAEDPTLALLRRQVERVVSGGRSVAALARSERRTLIASSWETAALLGGALADAASGGHRDAFGRLSTDVGAGFARAWLALAVHEASASLSLAESSWLGR